MLENLIKYIRFCKNNKLKILNTNSMFHFLCIPEPYEEEIKTEKEEISVKELKEVLKKYEIPKNYIQQLLELITLSESNMILFVENNCLVKHMQIEVKNVINSIVDEFVVYALDNKVIYRKVLRNYKI